MSIHSCTRFVLHSVLQGVLRETIPNSLLLLYMHFCFCLFQFFTGCTLAITMVPLIVLGVIIIIIISNTHFNYEVPVQQCFLAN